MAGAFLPAAEPFQSEGACGGGVDPSAFSPIRRPRPSCTHETMTAARTVSSARTRSSFLPPASHLLWGGRCGRSWSSRC